jgi:hypothetical protein
MAENHRSNRLKTFWLPYQTRKQNTQLEPTPILPAPNVPFHGNQRPFSRSGEHQLVPAKLVHMNKDRPRDVTVVRNGTSSAGGAPSLPSFESGDGTAFGEPLIQDFAMRSIPNEYRPFTAKSSDSHSLDLPVQRQRARVFSDDDDEDYTSPPTSRIEHQLPLRPSRFVVSLFHTSNKLIAFCYIVLK